VVVLLRGGGVSRAFLGTDIRLDSAGRAVVENGDIALVSGEDVLWQDLYNRLVCARGGLLGHPEFGGGLLELPGTPVDAGDFAAAARLELAKDPRVAEIVEASGWFEEDEPRRLYLRLAVRTADGQVTGNRVFPFDIGRANA
jgi:hypothetical protein